MARATSIPSRRPKERRVAPRLFGGLPLRVRYSARAGWQTAILKDFSESGFYFFCVSLAGLPERGQRTQFDVLIPLRLGGLLKMSCTGTVARVDQLDNGPVGVAIRVSGFKVPQQRLSWRVG